MQIVILIFLIENILSRNDYYLYNWIAEKTRGLPSINVPQQEVNVEVQGDDNTEILEAIKELSVELSKRPKYNPATIGKIPKNTAKEVEKLFDTGFKNQDLDKVIKFVESKGYKVEKA